MKVQGTRSIMIQQKKIEATENQLKVIKDKYLKDSPTIEAWLENIAENIALAEIIYMNDELRAKAIEGAQHTIVTADGPGAIKPNMILFHQGLKHDERHRNHAKFIENLYRLARENPQCAEIVRETADRFYNLMANWEFLPNSPTLMNAGRRLQQLSACYVLPVGDSIEEIYESIKNMALIHKSGGGCIVEGSKVFTTFCGLNNIETLYQRLLQEGFKEFQGATNGKCMDIRQRNIQTMSFNKESGVFEQDAITYIWRYDVAKGDTLTINLAKGIKLTTSLWHPFFVFQDGSIIEKRADQLQTQDLILLPNTTVAEHWPFTTYRKVDGLELDEELAWCIGVFIGDGSIGYKSKKYPERGYRLRVFDSARETLERFNTIISNKFNIKETKLQKDNREDCFHYLLQSNAVIERFMRITKSPAGEKTYTVVAPEEICKSPLSVIHAFFAGLLDSDGYISKSRRRLTFDTASADLAEQITSLLSLLGNAPACRTKTSKRKNYSMMYEVKVDADFMITFAKQIQPYLLNTEKIQRIQEKQYGKKARTIPLSFSAIEPILQEIGIPTQSTQIHKKAMVIGGKRYWLHRWKWGYFIDSVKLNNLLESILEEKQKLSETSIGFIKKLQHTVNYLAPVIAVTKPNVEKQFYDFTVDKNNNYLAGNFGLSVIHNTGFDFSHLRPAQDTVFSTKGVASGPLSFMSIFDKSTEVVKQGGQRRGANMGIMRYDHPNILDFIHCKKDNGFLENFNISVAIDAKFMEGVKNNKEYDLINPKDKSVTGKLNAREVFDKMCKNAWVSGDPGYVVIDRINNSDSNPTPAQGMIESTNPCVTGDTLISTEHGLLQMKELVEKYRDGGIKIATDSRVPVEIKNADGTVQLMQQKEEGISFDTITRAFSNGVKEVYKITTQAGYELTATADHKLLAREGKTVDWVSVEKLNPEMHTLLLPAREGKFSEHLALPFEINNKIIGKNGRKYDLNLPSTWSKELGQVLGWLIGDGWLRSGDKNCRVGFTFGKDDHDVMNYLKPIINTMYGKDIVEVKRKRNTLHLSYHSKYFVDFFKNLGVLPKEAKDKIVPEHIFTAPKETVVGFLQGLFSSDGTIGIQEESGTYYIRLTSKSRKLLQETQALLLNLGIKSRIYDRSREARDKLFRYMAKNGEIRYYKSDGICYELNISRNNIPLFLEKVGFICGKQEAKVKLLEGREYYEELFEENIVSIMPIGKQEVYDLTEPRTLSFITNGLLSLDCGEQPLLPYEPCFAPDTQITTKNGLETIETLYKKQSKGEKIIIATDNKTMDKPGISFREALVSKTGYKEIYEIELNNGQTLKVTPNHKVFTKDGWKRTDALTKEDYILVQSDAIYELVNRPELEEQKEDLLLGWLSGDGWFIEENRPCVGICFGPEEKLAQKTLIPLFKEFFECNASSFVDKNDVIQIATEKKSAIEKLKRYGFKGGKAPKKEIPEYIFTATPATIASYLGGLFSADGEVSSYRRRIRLSSASPKLIRQAQLLLLNFGIISRISKSSADKRTWYELAINGYSYELFTKNIGFPLSPMKQELMITKLNTQQRVRSESVYSRVKHVQSVGRTDVYDITEPETHSLIANGMIVHNCNLGSINLSRFVLEDGSDMDWNRFRECVHTCMHFLDNVIEVNNYPIPEIEEIAKRNRRVGLGVMGWAETLVKLNLPYNSDAGMQKAEEVMSFINDEALNASCNLAKMRGVFPGFRDCIYDKDGKCFRGQDVLVRNSARTTIAPTGTIGITAGLQGAGIEPFFAIVYVRYNAAGIDALKAGKKPAEKDTFFEVNPLFEKIAQQHNYFGLKKEELYKKIDENHKAVLGIKEIPEKIQKLFLTSHDLTPIDHVRIQAAFQKYCNNAVSKTVNLKNEATVDEVKEVYMKAYETGCKGVTIYRDGSKSLQVLNLAEKKTDAQKEKPVEKREKNLMEMSSYYLIETGHGSMHVHINYDQQGPTKIFANIAPSGTEISGLTTALAIMISKYLNMNGDAVKLLKHLNSIKGDRPFGFGPKRVDSIPHGMAKALRDHLIKTGKMKQFDNGQTILGAPEKKQPDISNGLFVLALHCPKCYSTNAEMISGCSEPTCFDCGYSKCS